MQILDNMEALAADLLQFQNSMALLEKASGQNRVSLTELQNQVDAACDHLIGQLGLAVSRRPDLADQLQAALADQVIEWFKRGRVANWAITKPLGYAGDFRVIEMIYQNEPAGSDPIGIAIDRWCLSRSVAQAVRNRRGILKELILGAAAEARGPVAVTSLASGPARELLDLFAEPGRPDLFATCVDMDGQALAFTAEAAEGMDVSDRFHLVQENVLLLSVGRSHEVIAPQNLIYSMGLIDYLPDKYVVRLLNWAYDHLLPGGRVVIGSFTQNVDEALMECILQWNLILRSPADLRALFGRSSFRQSRVEVKSDRTGIQLLAMARRD